MTERLTIWCSRRPWRALGIWAFAFVAAIAISAAFLGDALSGDEEVTSDAESLRADELRAERFAADRGARGQDATEVVVVRSSQATVDQPAFEQRVEGIAAELQRVGATGVTTFYETGERRLVSRDRDATGMLVALGSESDAEDNIEAVVDAVEAANGPDGFQATITGEFTLDADFSTLSEEDLRNGELGFGLPAALIVLLIVFGSLVAGVIPMLMAIVSIVVALALIALIGQAFPLSVFATNMLTGMGLALGIDYSLFILSRFREERLHGREKLDAIATVGATASRAVLFSGIAFTLAMLGLLLVPHTIMRSLAAGAIAAGLFSVVAALTLLPALLSLLGDRVNALRIPFFGRTASRAESPFWSRTVRGVMRRPLASVVLATAALLALAAPVLALRSGEAGVSTLPDRLAAKQGYVALNAEFPGETTEPVEIVVDGDAASPAVQAGIERVRAQLATDDLFGSVEVETNPAGDLTVLTVPIQGDPVGEEAIDAVRELRSEQIPNAFPDPEVEVLVGGDTAESIDESDTMDRWLPIIIAFVLGLSFVLLTVAFRSLVIACKAIVVNLLSVGAAYGLLVLVFQEGVGNEVFGFEQVDTIEAWVPLFLFAVLFGLSMDYHVFLLSRIRERFRQTGGNTDAVAHGVASTGRIITGAALIIIAVFSGFARGDLVMFQQMGFGVAVALLLDATVVRLVLVPAAMDLLGERNWYLPSWLRWLPDVQVEGAEAGPRASPEPVRGVS
ncbi:MAG TPA: MMPL family transporter [Solirubrobacterales bacterium]|jgi:RND superfamily putative drug exporter|nr:MMPL family transporter [Solirubrobacterales bacterium]